MNKYRKKWLPLSNEITKKDEDYADLVNSLDTYTWAKDLPKKYGFLKTKGTKNEH